MRNLRETVDRCSAESLYTHRDREAIKDFFDRKILEFNEVLASRVTNNFQLLKS
ncbi:MAG: hypothetical protein AAFQ78_02870 [Bacteroidota bacterium]